MGSLYFSKINIGFGVALVILAGIGVISYRNTVRLVEETNWVAHTYQVLEKLEEVRVLVKDIESARRGYILTNEESFLDPYYLAISKIEPKYQEIRQLTADNPQQQQRLDQLKPLISKGLTFTQEILEVYKTQGFKAGMEVIRLGRSRQNTKAIGELITQMEQEEMRLLEQRRTSSTASARLMVDTSVFGGVLAIGLIVLSAVVLNRQLVERARAEERLGQKAQELVGSEVALKRQSLLLQSILNSMGDGVAVADETGQLTLFNPALEKVLGVGITDKKFVEWSEHYHVFFPDKVTPYPASELPLVRALQNENVDDVELFICNKSDSKGVFLSVNARPIQDANGVLMGAVAVNHDITERKQAEEALQKTNQALARGMEQLEAANQELEAFSYSVSHDLRAPLRHINGFIALLRQRTANILDDKSLRYLEVIARAAQKMGELTDDLLSFSRIGRSEMHFKNVHLGRITQEVLVELKPEMQERTIVWKIDELPNLQGDPAMLKIVFTNLISNALKYTSTRTLTEIEIGCRKNSDEEVVCFVRDNGVGFDMQYVDKLFGVFQRLHTAEEFDGTGIGLATVRRIIHRHGGKIWAEGVVDGGAIFSFSLPKYQSNSW